MDELTVWDEFELERDANRAEKAPRPLLAGLFLTLLGGLAVVGVASAMEPDGDCNGYSYGYGCIDYEDAEITVEPSDNLYDRQTVTVTGTRLDPVFGSFGVAQCDSSLVEEFQSGACDITGSRITSVDGNGNATVLFVVRRIITTDVGGEIDCAVAGACELSGGTFEGFATALEGDRVPIQFDPAIPPIPRLEIEVAIDEVDGSRASGTVTCNRSASFSLDAQLTQERGGSIATAYGGFYGDTSCDVEPVEWTTQLRQSDRRLGGGPAELMVYAYAYDGFESAFASVEESVLLPGGPRAPFETSSIDGVSTSIEVIGTDGDGNIVVEVECGRGGEYVSVGLDVRQWAGRDRVVGSGFGTIDNCDGSARIALELTAHDGVLVGGPAQVTAYATVHDHRPPDFFHDDASDTRVIKLSGRHAPGVIEPEPNPDSRITIDSVSATEITGTVECDGATMVDVSASITQLRGRSISSNSGYGFVACDGIQAFSVPMSLYGDDLGGGNSSVIVSAYGYEIIEMDGYEYYLYIWDDRQEASARVQGR